MRRVTRAPQLGDFYEDNRGDALSRFRQQKTEAARRAAERRQREDEAPRLLEKVPNLESLTLEVQEQRAGVAVTESKYLKRIVVDHASALIELPCLDTTCLDGGYDLSLDILAALRAKKTEFEGQDVCHGHTKTGECQREIHYVGTATYRDE